MNKKLWSIFSILGTLILSSCSNNTSLTANLVQGDCPNGVNQAPYCMSVEINNNGGGQTWITSTSFPISGLSVVTNGVSNIQTPSTNQSLMDPNGCTNSTITPGNKCKFYLKISFESYSTLDYENINLTLNYTLNNTLFGNSSNGGSSSFTIYQVTNLYAAQSNGYVGIFNKTGSSNFYAESYGDPINTAVADTSSYGHLYIGGNNGIYRVGNESGNESSTSSISPAAYSGATTNLFTQSSNLYATGGSSVWQFGLSDQTWETNATYTLGSNLRPNANAISPSGVLYLASSYQVFTCGSSTTTTNCQANGVTTNSGLNQPGLINAIAFPNGGSSPYTGLFIGTSGGLYAESGIINSQTNTWVAVTESGTGQSLPSINAMTSYNSNLYAADNTGNIWFIPNAYTSGNPPSATKIATVNAGITAITMDVVSGTLYFAATSGNSSTIYGCSITQNSCTPDPAQMMLYPVVGLSIASQLVTSI